MVCGEGKANPKYQTGSSSDHTDFRQGMLENYLSNVTSLSDATSGAAELKKDFL
jgi:hypothetical protein